MNRLLAVVMCAIAVGLVVGVGLISPLDAVPLGFALVGLLFVVIGGFLGVRSPGNVVGWLMVAYGLLLEITTLLDVYVIVGLPESAWVAWISNWVWYPQVVVLVVMIPLYFPDGMLPNKRWRWVIIAGSVGWIGFGFGNAFTPKLLDQYGLANPATVELAGFLEASLQVAGVLGLFGAIVGSVAAAVMRFKKSSGQVRQQMKWFVSAAGLLAFSFVVNGLLYESGNSDLGQFVLLVASVVMAGAIATAVLKYRLYDIDRIISRTLAYALLVVVLGTLFALGVVAIPNLLIGKSAPPWIVASTTLVAAALFNPLRRRVQGAVDRRFNRSRYDSERVVGEFVASMQGETDPDSVVEGWIGVVSDVMQPSGVGVWLR